MNTTHTLAVVMAALAAAVAAEPTLRHVRTVQLDPDTWRPFNTASFDQDKVASFGDFQYTVFWDADKVMVLARRDLRDNTMQTVRLPQCRLTINPNDGHRNTVIGMSHADGRLHLSWDHHCNPLRYRKSRRGFLIDPPQKIRADDFEPPQPLIPGDKLELRVTYPRFLNDSEGRLYFVYRQGASGQGDTYIHRYDASTGAWSRIGVTGLFSRRGTYAPWQNSRSRNAYTNDILFDGNGRLHVTWTYRETGRTWASNHDLHYAYSDDGGKTWRNNADQQIADLPAGDPIELSDPGIVVWQIPVFSWLMNQTTMILDSQNRPHVITYKLPAPERPRRLEHNPPPEIAAKLSLFHYWRDADGLWHENGPITPLHQRPGVIFDADDTLIVYLAETGKIVYHLAEGSDQWQTWSTHQLTIPDTTVVRISKPDRVLARNGKLLSFLVVTQTSPKTRGCALLDLAVK